MKLTRRQAAFVELCVRTIKGISEIPSDEHVRPLTAHIVKTAQRMMPLSTREFSGSFEDHLAHAMTRAILVKRTNEAAIVADPEHTPTIEQALRHPDAFVDGMRMT